MTNPLVLYDIELLQLAIASLLLMAVEWACPGALRRAAHAIGRLSAHRRLSVLLSGLLGFGLSAALTAALGMPVPSVHDEFSYLLAADTFAHGRLANPPHPLWQHFEAVHVNTQPTYHSMYPPAQGLFLAVGQVLTGQPIVGVWLSMGLACAAVCWMLQAWCPSRWALVGTVLSALRFVCMPNPAGLPLQIGYWSQSYWGGGAALLGGALVFGGVRRVVQRPRARDAAWLALGLAVLANSRPFEGCVLGMPVAFVTLYAIFRHRRQGKLPVWPIILPLVIILGATFLWMGYYNLRTTGSALLRPRELNARLYEPPPVLLLYSLAPEHKYRHEHHRHYYGEWARSVFMGQQTPRGYWNNVKIKAETIREYYFGVLLSVPLLAAPCAIRGPWPRFALITSALVMAALALVPWFQIHYLSPIAPLFVYLEILGLRVLWLSRWRCRTLLRSLAAAAPLSLAIMMPVSVAQWSQEERHDEWFVDRQRLIERLKDQGGKHLILVSGNHSTFIEWVYNEADLDAAPVIWAHDFGPAGNRELLEYCRDRSVWRLEADTRPVRIRPYGAAVDR